MLLKHLFGCARSDRSHLFVRSGRFQLRGAKPRRVIFPAVSGHGHRLRATVEAPGSVHGGKCAQGEAAI